MDQAVNAGHDLGKGAEGHELDDLDLDHVADRAGVDKLGPGVVLGLLVAEGDAALLTVEADDINVYLLADGNDLGGVLDATPAELADVNHAVNAADVDKGAVAGEALDNAVVDLADLDLVPDGLGLLAALLLQDGTDGADDAAAAAVDLGDLQADSGLDQLGHRGVLRQSALAGGHEHAHAADADDNAALVLLGDNAFDYLAVGLSLLDNLPGLGGVETPLAELRGALDVIDADDNGLDRVADFDGVLNVDSAVVGELSSRDESGILSAEVNTHLGGRDSHNCAGYPVAIIYSFKRILQQFIEALFGRRLLGGCRFFSSGCGFLRGSGLNSRFGHGFGLLDCGFRSLICRVLLNQDLVAHLIQYLLDYPRRRACPCCDSYGVGFGKRRHVQRLRILYELSVGAALGTQLGKVQAVGAVPAADDNHRVTFRGQPNGLLLPRGRSRTYCIKYFRICTQFFY